MRRVPIDVHLMVKPVDRIVPDFAKAGAAIISFHPEASEHVDRTIGLIHECGCKAGLVFNPATPLDWLDHAIDKLDLVLIMSVNPGFGGQSFIPQALAKLELARARVDAAQQRTGRAILLEVDGGVKVDNIARDRQGGRRYVRRRLGDLRHARLRGDDREDARRARARAMDAEPVQIAGADGIVGLAGEAHPRPPQAAESDELRRLRLHRSRRARAAMARDDLAPLALTRPHHGSARRATRPGSFPTAPSFVEEHVEAS